MKKLKILVVGAGMYTCGKGTEGHGTILPSLFQARHDGLVDSISIAATSKANFPKRRAPKFFSHFSQSKFSDEIFAKFFLG